MSTVMMTKCWPLQIPGVAKSVLISLADNANDDGYCYPSIAKICQRVCYKKDAVINAIKWLEEAGLLKANRENGRHTTYYITIEHYQNQSVKTTSRLNQPVGQNDGYQSVKTTKPVGLNDKPVGQTDTNHQEPSITVNETSIYSREGNNKNSIKLPDWLPEDSWKEFIEFRKQIKKPMTVKAKNLAIKQLAKLRDGGNDPVEVIDQSIFHNWSGLFAVKANMIAGNLFSQQNSIPDALTQGNWL